jgi:excisionase family DNA binding protein
MQALTDTSNDAIHEMSHLAAGTQDAPADEWPMLRPEQVAHMLGVRTSWVYEAVRSHRLPCRRIGRHIRFTRRMIETWVAEQPGA